MYEAGLQQQQRLTRHVDTLYATSVSSSWGCLPSWVVGLSVEWRDRERTMATQNK